MRSALLSLVLAIVSPLSVTSWTRCSGAARRRRSRSSSQVTPGRKLRRPAGGMTRKQTTTADPAGQRNNEPTR
jgi:hypothetical protein